MSKFIIFGGSGFIGTALRCLLGKQGIEYIAPAIDEIDLRNESAREGISKIVSDGDMIVMIASYTQEHGEAWQLTDWNIRMIANIIAGIKGKNIAHFVNLSSDSVYGKDAPKNKILIDESTEICPDTLYGYMHVIREQFLRENIRAENITVLRPCAIYGARDTHNAYGINQFIRSAKEEGKVTLFGEGEENRSNVHVDDVAMIISQAVEKNISGVFNVNCGQSWSFKQIAQMVKSGMTKEVEINIKPRTIPITHRQFNNLKLEKAFFAPRLAGEGIKQVINQLESM